MAHGKYKGIVDRQANALWLRDIEIMALGVRGRMADKEIIRRIGPRVGYWQGEGKGVRVVLDRMHKATLSRINFQGALAIVAGEERLDGVALLTADPFSLREGTCGGCVATFKDVTVSVASVSANLNFGETFNVGGNDELYMYNLEVLESS